MKLELDMWHYQLISRNMYKKSPENFSLTVLWANPYPKPDRLLWLTKHSLSRSYSEFETENGPWMLDGQLSDFELRAKWIKMNTDEMG